MLNKFASVALLSAAMCFGYAHGAKAQTNVQFGVTSAVASNAPHFIAMELGFYKEQGLNVTWISAGSANNVIQQVAAGSLTWGGPRRIRPFAPSFAERRFASSPAQAPFPSFASSAPRTSRHGPI